MEVNQVNKIKNEFQCCFCGKGIKENVVSLIITTNFEKDEEKQQDQQFFCHINCFISKMSNPEYLYILEE